MPPAKRARTARQAQSTLSFSRTKPAPRDAPAAKPAKPDPVKQEPALDSIKPSDAILPTTEEEEKPAVTHEDEADVQEEAEVDDEEVEDDAEDLAAARCITEPQLKRYWADKESARRAPRVHQAGMGVREKILREFDMQTRFGPSIGIARLARWRRARELGMAPPVEVLAVLVQAGGDGGRSIMDELTVSSKIG